MKAKGYKVIKIYVDDEKECVLCDVAIFGENSLMVDNIQVCETIVQDIPYNREQLDAQYGVELRHNYINDTLVIH